LSRLSQQKWHFGKWHALSAQRGYHKKWELATPYTKVALMRAAKVGERFKASHITTQRHAGAYPPKRFRRHRSHPGQERMRRTPEACVFQRQK